MINCNRLMKRIAVIISSFFMLANVAAQSIIDSTKAMITSPDKNYVVSFYQKQLADGTRGMFYTLSYKQQPVITESALDLQLDNNLSERAMALKVDKHAKWCENLQVKAIRYTSKDTSWKPLYGERAIIRDNYNAVTIEMVKDDNPIYWMHVEMRVYNEGAAVRYFFPENIKGTYYRVVAENTSFTLPEGTKAWHASWAQAPYTLLPLQNWPDESERPLTLQLPNG